MDINFKYSHIYEQRLNEKAAVIPWEEIDSKIKALEDFWKEKGTQIENLFKEITGLSFKQKEITCYLNSTKSFSDPLTIAIDETRDMEDTLVHELIHTLLTGNDVSKTSGWKALFNRYKSEEFTTKVHIAIHAIHLLVAEKLFPDRVANIRGYSKMPAYVKSWEIVDQEGAEAIVDSIFNKAK